MVTAALLFTGMSAGVKVASARLSNAEVVFFRNFFGLLTLAPIVLRRGGLPGLATRHLREHLVRGLAGLGSMYCFFYAISRLRLADAVLLNYSLPLFLPVVEGLWLRERVPRRLWAPILVGFLGLVFILKPGTGLFQPAALWGVLAALLSSVAQVGVRRLTLTEPTTRIVFYFALISTLGSALPLPGRYLSPDGLWPLLLATGGFATIAQLAMTKAYAQAPAAQVGPFMYSGVVFAGIYDAWFASEWPDALSVLGALVVMVASALTLRLAPRPAPAEPAG